MIYIIKVNCQELGIIIKNVALLKANPSSHFFLTFRKQYDINATIMAGTPEQLGATAKTNLAEYYLRKLIENAPRKEIRLWRDSLGSFRNAEIAIGVATGKRINPIITETLGLDKLSWKVLGMNPMSALCIGGNFDPEERADINQALATIDLARRIDLSDGKEKPKPVPLFLRIAGVAKNNRIVAATYDLTDGNRLTRLNISLQVKEAISIKNDDYLISSLLNKLWITIPTNKNRPYHTAGLITQSMCDKAGATNESLPEFSNKALTFQLHEEFFVILGKPEDSRDTQDLNYAFDKMGYYIYRGNGFFKIGLGTADAARKHLEPWEISIPAALQKT